LFCPKCKAEYRPSFTHCPDCDVDLVYELPPDFLLTAPTKPSQLVAALWAAVGAITHLGGGGRFIADCRATLSGWNEYRRQTGRLPWLSILAHSANWFAVISGMILIFWYANRFHWSRWRSLGSLVLAAIFYSIFWYRLKREVTLNQLRTQRRLRREHLGF
jgi:hypothetical protein